MPSVIFWRDPFILCVDEVLAHLGDVFVPKYLCCGLCGLIVFVVGGLISFMVDCIVYIKLLYISLS